MKNLVKAFGGQEAETGTGFAQGDIFGVGELCGLGGVFVANMWVESGDKHQGIMQIAVHFLAVGVNFFHTVHAERCHNLCKQA